MRLRISARADQDFKRIFRESLSMFGRQQAIRYSSDLFGVLDHLVLFPESARARPEYRGKVRIWSFESHQIIYRVKRDEVVIVRVLHAHQDLKRHL